MRCFTWIGRSSAETPLAPAAGWMANCPCLPIKLCGSGRTNRPLVGLFRRHYLEAGEKAYRNDKTERPRKPCKHKASRVLLMVRLTGLEPVRRETHAPQTCLSAYSSTLAFIRFLSVSQLNNQDYIIRHSTCQHIFESFFNFLT